MTKIIFNLQDHSNSQSYGRSKDQSFHHTHIHTALWQTLPLLSENLLCLQVHPENRKRETTNTVITGTKAKVNK